MPVHSHSRATGDRRWGTIGKREETSRAPGQSDNPIHPPPKENPPNVDDHPDRRIADLWNHGLFEEERRLGQKFTFDIDARILQPRPATHRDDQLDASIRYDAVVDAAVSLAGEMKYQTLEALGEAVAVIPPAATLRIDPDDLGGRSRLQAPESRRTLLASRGPPAG